MAQISPEVILFKVIKDFFFVLPPLVEVMEKLESDCGFSEINSSPRISGRARKSAASIPRNEVPNEMSREASVLIKVYEAIRTRASPRSASISAFPRCASRACCAIAVGVSASP